MNSLIGMFRKTIQVSHVSMRGEQDMLEQCESTIHFHGFHFQNRGARMIDADR